MDKRANWAISSGLFKANIRQMALYTANSRPKAGQEQAYNRPIESCKVAVPTNVVAFLCKPNLPNSSRLDHLPPTRQISPHGYQATRNMFCYIGTNLLLVDWHSPPIARGYWPAIDACCWLDIGRL